MLLTPTMSSYYIFLRGKSKATIRAMIPMAAIIINCNVKSDNGRIRIINNGAMAVPKTE